MSLENLLLFRLDKNILGIPLFDVREVLRNVELKSLPSQPELISGIMNLRGESVPIIDLKKRFFIGNESNDLNSRILLIQLEESIAGLRVDEIIGIKELEVSHDLDEYIDKFYIKSHFINSVAYLNEEMVVVIDKNEIFNEVETELLRSINDENGS